MNPFVELKTIEGKMACVNKEHIAYFLPDRINQQQSALRFVSGDTLLVEIKYEELKKVLFPSHKV